jgi:DNA-binding XRE family transcriptional regulator
MQQNKYRAMHCVLLSAFLLAWCGMAADLRHQKLIGEAIRKYRKQAGLTQEKLAERADLHPVYVGEIERGEQSVSVHALIRISKALRVRLRDLVEEI